MQIFKSWIYELKREEDQKKRSEDRQQRRSERIGRIIFRTNHKIGLTLYKLDTILADNFSPMIDGLLEYERQELRSAFGNSDN